jgi:phosphoribosyl-AMP cyclohydrolase / phosphoribosyl-ATP pyrophosphohydrolase
MVVEALMTVKCDFNIQDIDWKKCQGLIPAIVQSALDHDVLMLGYMNQEALETTLKTGKATFYSRSRNCLWIKGETSGNLLTVKQASLDCDGDTILLNVIPSGPCCHENTLSCFPHKIEKSQVGFLQQLEQIIDQRLQKANPESSYVVRLAKAGIYEITRKVGEEALEVVLATIEGNKKKILEETADLLFHTLINLRCQNLSLEEVVNVLSKRHRSIKE